MITQEELSSLYEKFKAWWQRPLTAFMQDVLDNKPKALQNLNTRLNAKLPQDLRTAQQQCKALEEKTLSDEQIPTSERRRAELFAGLVHLHLGNYKKAMEYFTPSANENNADAQAYLGFMFQKGYGVKVDIPQAKDWYLRAAEQDNAEAFYRLAEIYHYGMGEAKDLHQALAFIFYEKAAKQQHAEAANALGFVDQFGTQAPHNVNVFWVKTKKLNDNDLSRLKKNYSIAIEAGNSEALFLLSRAYSLYAKLPFDLDAYNYVIPYNYRPTSPSDLDPYNILIRFLENLYADAGNYGCIAAKVELGKIYSAGYPYVGYRYSQSYEKLSLELLWQSYQKLGLKLLQVGADANICEAQYSLGKWQLEHKDKNGINLLIEAGENGYIKAFEFLAKSYSIGIFDVISPDPGRAAEFYRKAIEIWPTAYDQSEYLNYYLPRELHNLYTSCSKIPGVIYHNTLALNTAFEYKEEKEKFNNLAKKQQTIFLQLAANDNWQEVEEWLYPDVAKQIYKAMQKQNAQIKLTFFRETNLNNDAVNIIQSYMNETEYYEYPKEILSRIINQLSREHNWYKHNRENKDAENEQKPNAQLLKFLDLEAKIINELTNFYRSNLHTREHLTNALDYISQVKKLRKAFGVMYEVDPGINRMVRAGEELIKLEEILYQPPKNTRFF